MKLTVEQAVYGLRNLAVMDEEETRIRDEVGWVEPNNGWAGTEVYRLAREGQFTEAYELAIKQSDLATLTRPQVKKAISAWWKNWGHDCIPMSELITIYDNLFPRRK